MRRSSAGRAVTLMETVRRAISVGEADAYFVHVLLPHPPFEVDSMCVGYPNLSQRRANIAWRSARRNLEAYAEQLRCTHRLLAGLVAALDSTVGRDQSVVVVQGDHGSRLVRLPARLANYTPEVLNQYYSTLFAVRAPSLRAGSVAGAIQIQDLLRSLFATDFTRAEIGSGAPYVIGRIAGQDTEDSMRILSPGELLWVPSKSEGDFKELPRHQPEHDGRIAFRRP